MTGVAQLIDWQAIAPPLVLACVAIVVLLVDAFAGPPRTRDGRCGGACGRRGRTLA